MATEFEKEIITLQQWINTASGLDSIILDTPVPQINRPIIVLESPDRVKSKNLTQYTYIISVKQYGKLYVNSVVEAVKLQELLIKDIEEKYGILAILNEENQISAYLNAVDIAFIGNNGLDIPFIISYEITYKRAQPVQPLHAAIVSDKIKISREG